MTLSVSSDPWRPMLSLRILLILLTAVSARMLACGLYAEDKRCLTCQLLRNSCVAAAVYVGPLSVAISSGTPYEQKNSRNEEMSSWALSDLHYFTMGQLEYLSTMIR